MVCYVCGVLDRKYFNNSRNGGLWDAIKLDKCGVIELTSISSPFPSRTVTDISTLRADFLLPNIRI